MTAALIAGTLALSGCAAGQGAPEPTAHTPSPTHATPTATATATEEADADTVVDTVIQFSAAGGTVEVTVDADTPAVRDFLSALPMTVTFEDFAGNEKIAYPPRTIRVDGSPPSSAGAGDFAIYVPWGNLALFYEGERGAPSADIIRLGTFSATEEQLAVLENGDVTITAD